MRHRRLSTRTSRQQPLPNKLLTQPSGFDALLHDALLRGQSLELRASTSSMWPTIFPGELLTARGERPERGDIALVWEGQWVAHRVIDRQGGRVCLRGDHPMATAHWVNEEQ